MVKKVSLLTMVADNSADVMKIHTFEELMYYNSITYVYRAQSKAILLPLITVTFIRMIIITLLLLAIYVLSWYVRMFIAVISNEIIMTLTAFLILEEKER